MSADAKRGLTQIDGGSRASKPGSRVVRWSTNAALTLAAGFAAIMLLPAVAGLERYVITGDSMSGTYDRGSVIFSEVVPVDRLEVGDVITYDPPGAYGGGGLVTHRVIAIDDRGGRPVLRTKGDANASRDPWRFRLEGAEQARAVAGVPYVGYAFAALGMREVRIAVIGVPALLIAFALLAGLWRETGEAARDPHAAGRPTEAQGS
jgi:signal peptidase